MLRLPPGGEDRDPEAWGGTGVADVVDQSRLEHGILVRLRGPRSDFIDVGVRGQEVASNAGGL
jgi:hypothetical protein